MLMQNLQSNDSISRDIANAIMSNKAQDTMSFQHS